MELHKINVDKDSGFVYLIGIQNNKGEKMYRVIEMSGLYLGQNHQLTYYRHEAMTFPTYREARVMAKYMGSLWNVDES